MQSLLSNTDGILNFMRLLAYAVCGMTLTQYAYYAWQLAHCLDKASPAYHIILGVFRVCAAGAVMFFILTGRLLEILDPSNTPFTTEEVTALLTVSTSIVAWACLSTLPLRKQLNHICKTGRIDGKD